jgi:uncharacterized membrane protein YhaH (DUF805 family)
MHTSRPPMFAKLFSFDGRVGRAAYLRELIGGAVLAIAILALSPFIMLQFGAEAVACVVVAALVLMLWNELAVTVRRLHDVGKPGWQCLLLLVPYYNVYFGFMLLCMPSEARTNRYGPNPQNPLRDATQSMLEQALECESRGDWSAAFQLYRRVYEEKLGDAESEYARECIERMHGKMQLAS